MRTVFASFVVAGILAGCCAPPPTVVFLSDFGTTDDSVAVCKGEMIGVAPHVRVVDITHQVTPYAVDEAARLLAGAMPSFPEGTVFVCVVDPGVGSDRRPVAVRTASGQFYVGPDNGLITLVDGVAEAREIVREDWMRGAGRSSTFHGRDIFSPVAAHLARGDAYAEVGPAIPVSGLVRLPVSHPVVDETGVTGEVIGLDGPYGNLVTNIPAAVFERLGYAIGDPVALRVGGATVTAPFVRTFSDVAEGLPLVYIDSRGRLAAAINMGDFAKVHGVVPPAPIGIRRKGEGK